MNNIVIKTGTAAFIFFMVLALGGCVKDNGNYDYRELPALEIDGFIVKSNGSDVAVGEENSVYISKNANVEISPAYNVSEELDPIYEWILYPNPNTEDVPGTVLSTEPVLTHKFVEKPGKYDLVLRMMNTEEPNDFNNYLMIALTIESVNGIAILHRDASGAGDVAIFKSEEIDLTLSGNNVVFEKEVYSNVNGGKISNPMAIAFDYEATNRFHLAYGNGVKYLDVEMMDTDVEMTKIFYRAEDIPQTLSFAYFVTGLRTGTMPFSFMIANNKLYGRTSSSYYENHNQYLKMSDADYCNLIVINKGEWSGHVAFNRTDKCFEYLDYGCGGIMWGMDYTFKPKKINSLGGEVDIAGTQMDAVEFGKISSTLNAIMKDENGYYVVGFTYPENGAESECLYKTDITSLEGVGENSVWEVGSKGEYIFYSNGSTLYTYSIANNTSSDQKLGLTSGSTIVKLELFEDNSGENSANDGALLFVVTKDGGSYSFHQFAINPLTGKVDALSRKSAEGLGEVVDIVHIPR